MLNGKRGPKQILQFDIQLPSRLYNLLKDDVYGIVFNAYSTDECPECGAGKKHLGQALDMLLCHACKKVTAIILV